MSNSYLLDISFTSSIEAIALYKKLVNENEYILSKQFLKSATSVGANLREAKYAESNMDFIHKFKIALKECNETLYWLDLIKFYNPANDIEISKLKENYSSILRMISASIKTCKNKEGVSRN